MFSFIILHYKSIDETLKCLEYLHKLDLKDSHIVIVDNNSLNSKEEELLNNYKIDILKLDDNYGFAKANNFGIEYAKNKYDSAYYIVMNNDVFISDIRFLNIIVDDYEKYQFDILGPFISSTSNESVNPFPVIGSKAMVEKEINKCKWLIRFYSNPFSYYCLKFGLKIKSMIRKPKLLSNGNDILFKVPLHGCCLIFSKKYIYKYSYPFYNDTFLFHEEEFIYQRVIKDDLISVYDPKLKVFHKEGSSVSFSNNKVRNSKLFREKTRLKSLYLLLDVMVGKRKYE